MSADEVREWLDKLISNKNELDAIKKFNNQIISCGSLSYILLMEGIEIVADLIGVRLTEEKRDCDLYPYVYYFYYNGNIFRQLSRERLGVYAGND